VERHRYTITSKTIHSYTMHLTHREKEEGDENAGMDNSGG